MPKQKKNQAEIDRYRKECLDHWDPNVVIMYDMMIDQGTTPRFAQMLALQSPPMTKNTERSFNEGTHEWADRLTKTSQDYIFQMAKSANISTQGKVYKSGLGKPNDPMAWVSGPDDVVKACKAKGYSVSGAVNHKEGTRDPKRVRMSKECLAGYVNQYTGADPSLAEKVKKSKKAKKDLEGKIIEKHSKPIKD